MSDASGRHMQGYDSDTVEVAIVGAGLSGLTAARELRSAGIESLLILEARDRVGGRTVNHKVGDGVVSEGGGQWIGPTQTEVFKLAEELGIETFESYRAGNTVYFVGEQTFTHDAGNGGIVANSPLIDEINAMARELPSAAPWTAPRAADWDKLSVADWLAERSASEEDQLNFFLSATLTYGAPPEKLGLLHYLTLINSFDCDLQRLESMKDGAQERRLVGGSWILSSRLSEGLEDKLRLSSPVRRIAGWDGELVEIHADATIVSARQVIFSPSQGIALNVAFEPALPAERAEMHAAWPVNARMRKATHVYARPFWRDAGFNGQVLDIGGALLWSADNSPPDGSVGILTCFVREGALTPDPDQAGRELAAVYARAFGEEALHYTQYHEIDWGAEEWTRSCVSPYPPGFLTRWGAASREPMGRIVWAGTDMAELHPSSMDGAIRAGRKAAEQTLTALGRERVPA